MRLFKNSEGYSICLDLRKVQGVLQEHGSTLSILFDTHKVLVHDDFKRVWDAVEKAKQREEAL